MCWLVLYHGAPDQRCAPPWPEWVHPVEGTTGGADPELRVRGLALYRFSSAEAAECLAAANHSLVFVGDSVTRFQYASLVKFGTTARGLTLALKAPATPASSRGLARLGSSWLTAMPCLPGAAASRAAAAVRARLPHMRCPHIAVRWRLCAAGGGVTATTQRGPLGGRRTWWREGTTGSHRRPPPTAVPHHPPTPTSCLPLKLQYPALAHARPRRVPATWVHPPLGLDVACERLLVGGWLASPAQRRSPPPSRHPCPGQGGSLSHASPALQDPARPSCAVAGASARNLSTGALICRSRSRTRWRTCTPVCWW